MRAIGQDKAQNVACRTGFFEWSLNVRFRPIAVISLATQSGRMTDGEQRILSALALMCEQYIGGSEYLDHECISAGEDAVAVLAEYGLVEMTSPREAKWTSAGKALLG